MKFPGHPTPNEIDAALAVLETWNNAAPGTPEPAGVSEALRVVIAFASAPENSDQLREELVRALIPDRPDGFCVFCGRGHPGDCPRA